MVLAQVLLLGFSAALSFAGEADRVAALNAEIVTLLAPYNNPVTSAKIVFSKVTVNESRAVELAFSVSLHKKGTKGEASLEIPELRYHFPEAGGEPELVGKLALKFDVLSVVTQEQVNEMGPSADRWVKEFADEYARKYKGAARVDARITHKEVDDKGNLKALGLALEGEIDLAKLPPDRKPEDEVLRAIKIEASGDLKGVDLTLAAIFNPNAEQFKKDGEGLKELLEKLLARDPKLMKDIVKYAEQIDQWAIYVVGGERGLGSLIK
ncbi:MAG: hypothetical protein A3J74_02165 [Elusimicrobia bacterium RIFCSPHIGHO2_02_FULL_57_9]|nr:MAG: hypothetical protein A3J74_02165 [Elusimicrobia bacterium RIFCSPHIGHO2_02_FULL_57_9]